MSDGLNRESAGRLRVSGIGNSKLRVLFIHQNFPGQFRRIAFHLSRDPDVDVLSIGKQGCPMVDGVRTLTYSLHRSAGPSTHHYARQYENSLLHGQAVLRVLMQLKSEGYVPDVIVAHSGWGETLFVKDVFPSVRLVSFSEYYYRAKGADFGFDPEFKVTLDDRARVRVQNAQLLMGLDDCDVAVTPTNWQKSLHPAAYRDKIQVVHEGIDTEVMTPNPFARFALPCGRELRYGDPVVTYVARNLEPYRGFHVFMRALPELLANNPNCDVVIAGGDGTSYGKRPIGGSNWRTKLLAEVSVDPLRVHFVGQLTYARYRTLLQVSAAHVYLTYPFILSWSMLEAMSCGCLLIGSRTPPVSEVIVDGENGMLVNFFDGAGLVKMVSKALREQESFQSMRSRARATISERYSLAHGLAGYRRLLLQPNALRRGRIDGKSTSK